jgi:hypothetical protein
MEAKHESLHLAGKGLILAPPKDGIPRMRRLVGIYTNAKKAKFIKLDGQFTPLTSSHLLI